MVASVTNLNTCTPILPHGAYPEIIELLERWLDNAKKGELIAVALIGVNPADSIVTNFSTPNFRRSALVAGTVYLQHDLSKD